MIFNFVHTFREFLEAVGLYRFLQVFQFSSFRAVAAVLVSFVVVVLFGRRAIRWLIRQKVGDNPQFDHTDLNHLMQQKQTTPTMGGILITTAVLVASVLLADMTNFYVQMGLLCLLCYGGLGFADDWLKLTSARRSPTARHGLRTWEKILFQAGFALLFGFFIFHHGINNEQTRLLALPFQRTINPHTMQLAQGLIYLGAWQFVALSIVVISGTSNAVNLTDGMDGLASGIMAIVCFAFLALCIVTGQRDLAHYLLIPYIPGSEELAVIAGAMLGACLGFLWFNCHPAQVFMGDTGSLPLGALVGFIAVVIRQEVLLFLIGGVLVAEVMSVVLQVSWFKTTRGSRLFKCTPIHHHFHLSGWTEQQVVVRFWLISALLAALALATLKLR